jgi:hypothetical protein
VDEQLKKEYELKVKNKSQQQNQMFRFNYSQGRCGSLISQNSNPTTNINNLNNFQVMNNHNNHYSNKTDIYRKENYISIEENNNICSEQIIGDNQFDKKNNTNLNNSNNNLNRSSNIYNKCNNLEMLKDNQNTNSLYNYQANYKNEDKRSSLFSHNQFDSHFAKMNIHSNNYQQNKYDANSIKSFNINIEK